MEAELITLFVIVVAAFICPVVSAIIPRKLIPETVFLLICGMVVGPHVLGWAQIGDAVTLLSDLGLGFLFLLAGYEINPKDLASKRSRHGLVTWFITFAIAIGIVFVTTRFESNPIGWLAVAIALTTTAFGTLVPILADRGIESTRVGKAILSYGAWGELMPIIAIALLLTTRATWVSIVILLIFALIAVTFAFVPKKLWSRGARLTSFISDNAETNAQMTVRAVMCLLVGMIAVSAIFDLDIVLGAFAAGFALRFIIPQGNEGLEHKLRGIGYGFFIPLFFIVSGTKIDPASIVDEPLLLVLFIAMLLLVRAVPIFVSLSIAPKAERMDARNRATVAIYCTTALPLIVAVTTVAVHVNAMSQNTASLLVAAGGITVFLMPLLASITFHTIDADLNIAAKEIRKNPGNTLKILETHQRLERKRSRKRKKDRAAAKKRHRPTSRDSYNVITKSHR